MANDLHQVYGIDLGDDSLWQRPWYWLRSRILGLLDVEGSRVLDLLRARST